MRRLLQASVLLLVPGVVWAEVEPGPVNVGGYFRVMTRPDFQGGDSRLGYSTLYGRLLNEGPWGALELRLSILDEVPGANNVWTSLHAKIEGGSVANADVGQGKLDRFALTQLYAKFGNVLIDRVTWQIGTLNTYLGDLGLYDLRIAEIFFETLGLSARYQGGMVDLLVGVGDSGYGIRRTEYDTILTAGGYLRLHLSDHFEIAAGGQVLREPGIEGNRFAPYTTPDVRFEDFLRHEVAKTWLDANPGREDLFPPPLPTSSSSYKAIGYLGFGGFGPIEWNSLFVNYLRRHPDNFYTETFEGRDYQIFVKELTDQRYQLNLGDQVQLSLVPRQIDAAIAFLYGSHWNDDNQAAPSDDDRSFYSGVLRLQLYVTRTVHCLVESSVAYEKSKQGNRYREHLDSVFANEDGVPDTRGFEYGDSASRTTWQGKMGMVLNPLGYGLFTRPSLRILYGVQYSTQTNAFGNSFVESLDQFNYFGGTEQHWHHVLALEVEAWF